MNTFYQLWGTKTPKEAKELFIQRFIELFPEEAYNEFKNGYEYLISK